MNRQLARTTPTAMSTIRHAFTGWRRVAPSPLAAVAAALATSLCRACRRGRDPSSGDVSPPFAPARRRRSRRAAHLHRQHRRGDRQVGTRQRHRGRHPDRGADRPGDRRSRHRLRQRDGCRQQRAPHRRRRRSTGSTSAAGALASSPLRTAARSRVRRWRRARSTTSATRPDRRARWRSTAARSRASANSRSASGNLSARLRHAGRQHLCDALDHQRRNAVIEWCQLGRLPTAARPARDRQRHDRRRRFEVDDRPRPRERRRPSGPELSAATPTASANFTLSNGGSLTITGRARRRRRDNSLPFLQMSAATRARRAP